MISKDSIENLKSLIDIVDVVSNYIELKKSGSNYKALCPFHTEKTPSFVVSPAKQIYHCFGCGASGDAIKFVMEMEKLSYKEAIEKLASMYNFKLEYVSNKEFLSFSLLEKVNNFYKGELYKNKKAYEYLKNRGVLEFIIEKFELGYAPDKETQLKFFKDANLDLLELTKLGVLVDKQYPRLIERITFPIYSPASKIIAFGGRTISNHPAKYINFTNTKLFNKSKTFYGFNFAREHILRKKEAIIVEGYMDVIMLHQAGIENSIATLGTSLTKEHLPLLKKINPKVIIAYDGDTAGINAALRASKLLFSDFFEGGVVLFEDDTDPADLVKEGKDVSKYFKEYIPFDKFIIEYTIKKFNLKNPFEKKKAVDELREYISNLSEILQEDLAFKASQYLQVSFEYLISKPKKYSPNLSKKIDIAEATIIKTLYYNTQWLNEMIEYLVPEMFNFHKEELQLVYQEDFDNPKLLDIVLRDDIIVLDYKSLKTQIIKLLIPYYKAELQKLKMANINHDTKAHLLKEINYKLKELQKGNLVESTLPV